MLLNPPKSTTTAAATAKQIVVNVNSGSVVYTVPTGKTFIGSYTSTAASGSIYINGVLVYANLSGTPNGPCFPIPLTLVAGTVVTGNSSQGSIFGVEQ